MYIDLLVSANPGMTEPELREFLESVGWVDSEIEKGIAHFASKKVAQKAPQQNSAPTAQATPVTPAAPVAPTAPAVQTVPVMPPPVTGPSAVANPFIPTPNVVATPLAQAPAQPQQGIRPGQSLTQAQVSGQQSQQGPVSFGLKPVPAFEGMPHQADAQLAAMQTAPLQGAPVTAVRPAVAQPMPQPATVEQPEVQPFNQAGFVQAPAPADTRFANGIRRVPSGMGAMGVTAPELTPSAQQASVAGLNQDALSSPLNTTPEAYAGYTDAPKAKSHALLWVVALFIFAASAGTVAAQFLGYTIIPRSVLSTFGLASNIIEPDEFFTRLVKGAESIQSASYAVRVGLKVENRDVGDTAFVPSTQTTDQVVYKRDAQRFEDVKKIFDALYSVYNKEQTYPYTLDSLKVPTKDSMGNQYVYRRGANGKTFEIAVMFESSEALELSELFTKNVKGNIATYTDRSAPIRNAFSAKPRTQSLLVQSGAPTLLGAVDSQIDAGLEVNGTFDRRPQSADGALSLKAYYYNVGVKEDAEVNFLKKDKLYFGQLAVIPNLIKQYFPSTEKGLNAIEGKWVGDTSENILASDNFSWLASALEGTAKTPKKASTTNANAVRGTQLGEMIVALQRENMIKYRQKPVQESVNSVPAYRYDIVLDYERLADFVDRLKKDLDARYGDASIMKDVHTSTIEYLRSVAFMDEAHYFNDHSSFVVWITADGKPIKIASTQAIIPDDTFPEWKGRKAVFSVVTELTKLNEPVVIEVPKQYISMEGFGMLYSGYTSVENAAAKQIERIKRLRTTLSSYNEKKRAYPAELAELTHAENLMEYNDPLTEKELVDVYTQKPFVYRVLKNNTTYELDYTVTLPSSTTNSDFARAVSEYHQVATTRVSLVRTLTAVNGLNTATPKNASAQRERAPVKDTDKDGYSDELEKYMGRNPLKIEKNTFPF